MSLLILIILLSIGFFYRIYGLNVNYSFWTDEEHVAIFSRAILERGKPVLANGYSAGAYQWLQYWLSAISAKIFGLNEFAVRLPSVIFGVLTIWATYFFGKELFNKKIGLLAAFFITFLKIEILWSRQARPYQALQFFFVLGAWFIYRLAKEEKFKWRYFSGFLTCGVLASLMHGLGLVFLFNGFLYLLLSYFSCFKKQIVVVWGKGITFLWVTISLLVFLSFAYSLHSMVSSIILSLGEVRNSFYYRVFLWHNYSLLVFLSLIGILFQIFQKKKSWLILFLFLAIQGIIVSLFLPQPFVRYLYIVFPFLILFSAVGLVEISHRIVKISNFKNLILIFLAFFIVAMGNKFTLLPQRIYSLNEDMQEIPEVDWKKIYGFAEEKLVQNGDAILVTNWTDLPVWFLGEKELSYLLRRDSFVKIDSFTGAKVVTDLTGFREIVQKEKKGLIIIDSWDNYVPDGIREYCREDLKKELEIDRLYEAQPRYWPVEVYSWGMDDN